MSIIWIAVLLAAPTTESAASAVSAGSAAQIERTAPPRSGREQKEAVETALRRWAKVADKDADAAACEFLALYHDLQSDSKLPVAQREELRRKVRGRLAQLAQKISRRLARQTRDAARAGPASVSRTKDLAGVLGQQAGAAAGPAAGAGGAANADDDYGPELVDLIQKTIAPTTWDVNGGPGVIYYWRNQRALVITAGDDVHDDVADVLEQLQRAGR